MTNENLSLSEKHAELIEERRKIGADTCVRLGIISHPRDEKVIGFQTWDVDRAERTTLAYTKWRGPEKDFRIEPAKQRLRLWNLPPVEAIESFHGGTLIITEGEFDAASFEEAGLLAASVPNGAGGRRNNDEEGAPEIDPLTDRQFSYLWGTNGKLIPELACAKRIILATDADEPGEALREDLAIRLGADRVLYVTYPEDCKDANEVLIKHGLEAVRKVFDTAYMLIPNRLSKPSEVTAMKRGGPYHSGWSTLDNHLILCPPELIIVTGVPGAGKTQWTANWLMNISRVYGIKGSIIQFEDGIDRLKNDIALYEDAWISKSNARPTYKGWGDDYLRILGPSVSEDEDQNLEWLEHTIWEAACRHDCKWIMIDPWNELSHMFAGNMREDQYLNNAVRKLKKLARRYGIAIVIVAHPDKQGGRNEGIEAMSLYSIAGGAVWKNKADGGIIIGKEVEIDDATGKSVETGRSIAKIDKRKDWGIMGRPGAVVMEYNEKLHIFTACKPMAT